MIKPIIHAAFALIFLIENSIAATVQPRAPAQQNLMPISFTWKSTYWPLGLRQWSQTAPDQWTEKYEDGTPDRKFRLLGSMSMGGACKGLHLKSAAEPLEAIVPGSRCSSKWLLFRWVSIYTSKPEWVGQAESKTSNTRPNPHTSKLSCFLAGHSTFFPAASRARGILSFRHGPCQPSDGGAKLVA